ncbi:MAG: DUF1844 domain-containing protein [Deltaproteobacteria bacterium]|nr:DUF1844 domain-containing protein [Deltaproteobacteria bacterium]
MEEQEKGFIIKDKRTFSSDTGKPRDDKNQGPEQRQDAEQQRGPGEEKAGPDTQEEIPLPEVNFSTFIFSMSSSALLHFGEVPDPATGRKNKNLPMAKHTIDILGMLEEKTRGNLTEDESQLLKNILYDLRMRYVKETT